MHDEPRNSSRSTSDVRAASRTFTWMRTFSLRKSTGYAAFAMIPPTFAAARTT